MQQNEFDERLDHATHLVLAAFGLLAEETPDTADTVNETLRSILGNLFPCEEDETNVWFALADDGQMYCLCDCGDIAAAEESAKDLGINAIWLADEATARQWQDRLNDNIPSKD